MPTRYDPDRDQLATLLGDEPRYRVDQVWRGLYELGAPLDELTTLPRSLRERLAGALPDALEPVAERTADAGETTKWLFRLHDGVAVETVLMRYPDRATVCVSSQAGCAMGCTFCATGQVGFDRHLGVGEIVEQVVRARRAAAPARLSNVVFMGMGEPLANYEHTWRAVERIHGALGLSARGITVSTVGIVPGMHRLAGEALPVNLAVSLHAADDDRRDELVPVNRRYPIDEVVEACIAFRRAHNRRVSFEWALIDGVNDRPDDARRLAALARRARAHVNLIPLNPTPGYAVRGSAPVTVAGFADLLRDLGVNVTVRRTRGVAIDAACGQLRADHAVAVPPPARR